MGRFSIGKGEVFTVIFWDGILRDWFLQRHFRAEVHLSRRIAGRD